MANNRIVALQLQLKGVSTIEDLEKVLKDINKELKQTDVNSEAYKKLSQSAVEASGKLAGLKENLKGISESKAAEKQAKEVEKLNALYIKQADSVAKVGAGIGAGLSVATIAASHFGEETSESVQKAIRTASELTVVLQSIKPISEAINGENIKLFNGFIDGFKSSALGAKLFGNTTKTAIAATGIGALVIGISLLVANWDAVTSAVKRFIDSTPFLSGIGKVIDNIREKVGSLGNLFGALGAGLKALLQLKDPIDAFSNALANGVVVENLNNQLEAIDKNSVALANQIKVLEALGNKQTQVFALKKKGYEDEIKILEDLKKSDSDFGEEQNKRLEESKLNLELLLISERKFFEEKQKLRSDELIKLHEHRIELLKLQDELKLDELNKEEKHTRDLISSVQNRIKELEEIQKQNANADVINFEEIESERVDAVEVSEGRINAIRSIHSKLHQNRLGDALQNEIDFLEEKRDLTEEEEEILFQLKVEKLQAFVDIAAEIIGKVGDISQAITDGINNNIDTINNQIEGVDQKYQSSINEREALEARLATADGARKEQVLASIDEEREKQKELEKQKKDLTNQRIRQENKAQQVKWANDLVNAIVGAAQGVLAGLAAPFPLSIPMSIINGVIGGAQVAIVASNKPKSQPLLAAKGGHTIDLLNNGGHTGTGGARDSTGERKASLIQTHGGEWIAPRWMVENQRYGTMISQLEAVRTRGYANGGFTSTTVPQLNPSINDNSFNASILEAIQSIRPVVSVEEVTTQQNRVEVISSRASI